MGRYVKNFEIKTGAYAARLPIGTGVIAPDSPVDGQTRFNLDTETVEYYANASWHRVAKEGRVEILKDTFYPDGISTDFGPLAKSYLPGRETDVMVFIGNIFQNPGVAYTVNDTTITFTSVPDLNQDIIILHNLNSTETE